MVEMGWPYDDLDDLREASLVSQGKHVRTAIAPNGVTFAWTKHQKVDYEPRHAWPEKLQIGTVIYDKARQQFAMVVPASGPFDGRQPVFSGPHTNYGQPCGGYGCSGSDPYCDECQGAISAEHDERWAEYYAGVMPMKMFYGDDQW